MFYWICKFTSIGRILLLTLCSSLLLSSCSGLKTTPVKEPEEPVSVLSGKPGGIKLSDFGKKDQPSDGLPINALLWRAALDIASFVPLDDVDTFGGSIVTEWHLTQTNLNERLKLAIFVIGRELRSDAIKVRAYVQKQKAGNWVDAGRDEALSRKLEGLILNRARELRSAALSETVK